MERSSFFNSIDRDRLYNASVFADYFNSFISNGVFPNPATNLQVFSNNDMTITIAEGKGWINGYIYTNTDDLIKSIEHADGVLDRIDRVVVQLNFLTREIKIIVKKGAFASNPIAPVLQRDADIWEIALADIYIVHGAVSILQENITNLRLNKEVCGIVHGTVEQADTTAIFNQFQDWYSRTKDKYDTDINKWTAEKKNDFDTWYAQNTTAFMDQFNNWFNSNTTTWGNEFTTWFDAIKSQLDGDIAAKLSADIIELKNRANIIENSITENSNKIGVLNGSGETKEKLNKEEFDSFKANIDGQLTANTTNITNIDTQLDNYKFAVTASDADGKPTQIQYKRTDDTLYSQVDATNPNSNGFYQTFIEKYYDTDGATLLKTVTWTIGYNDDGLITARDWVVS